MEFNLFMAPHIASQSADSQRIYFEQFWESDAPRIGDQVLLLFLSFFSFILIISYLLLFYYHNSFLLFISLFLFYYLLMIV